MDDFGTSQVTTSMTKSLGHNLMVHNVKQPTFSQNLETPRLDFDAWVMGQLYSEQLARCNTKTILNVMFHFGHHLEHILNILNKNQTAVFSGGFCWEWTHLPDYTRLYPY